MQQNIALSIAGFDGSGGAGIQADLKTFYVHNVYGLSIATSLTVQNTRGVSNKLDIKSSFLKKQLKMLAKDIKINSVKIGMLANAKNIHIVSNFIKKLSVKTVLDPVILSTSGYKLLNNNGIKALKKELFPLVYLITPNIPEAELLTGLSISNTDNMKKAAKRLQTMGVKNILIKGGHLKGKTACDILLYNGKFYTFKEKNSISNQNFHGTGCILSSAITAHLAKGKSLKYAVKKAKKFITRKIKKSFFISKEGAKYLL